MTPPTGSVLDASVLVASVRLSESAHGEVRALLMALTSHKTALYTPTISPLIDSNVNARHPTSLLSRLPRFCRAWPVFRRPFEM